VSGDVVTVEVVVAAGKRRHAHHHARIEDSVLAGHGDGPPPEPADIVLTVTPDDAEALRDGRLDLSVGYMRGQVKMAGDFGALLRLLPLTFGDAPPMPAAALVPG
jgi:hypothetical protein